MEFRSHTLDNGLEIVAECNPAAYSHALGFFVRAGARDETAAEAGVSHFLEHMVFKGTPTRSADDVNREFDAMGAHNNASTGDEITTYYAFVLPEYQTPALELLADIMRPTLRQDDFDMEKQVILEEIRMYLDQPPFGADDHVKRMCFGRHPLGNSVLGTVESITALTIDAMHDYFQRRYCPSNLILVAAGQVDFEALVATAERCCGRWPRADAPRTIEPAQTGQGFDCLIKHQAAHEYFVHMAAGPAAESTDRFAAKLLATVLGDESGSRLFWELVDPGHAEYAYVGHHGYQGVGAYYASLSSTPDFAADNLRRLLDVFRQIEATGPTEEELALARSKIASRLVLGSERPSGRLFKVGVNWATRREYRTVRDDLNSIEAVSPDDLVRLLARYPLSHGVTVAVGPLTFDGAPA